MKEYIKKFVNPAAADQYAIKDIPFITSVDGDPIQNLHCNLSGKKLVNVGGIIEVQGAGPEMVDLGLSVKWAKANVGATCGGTAESWYGGYYAWGETETKSDYSWSTYKFGTMDNLTKYNSADKLTVLQPEDDVVTVTYGSNYRIPTKEEIEELIALPNKWVTDYNGIFGLNGYIFTGTNGNTLFIPTAGYFSGSTCDNTLSRCYMWTSSLILSSPDNVKLFYFDSSIVYTSNSYRHYGCSVRAVQQVSNS